MMLYLFGEGVGCSLGAEPAHVSVHAYVGTYVGGHV